MRLPRCAFTGVFFLALSVILLQIALTRVFAIMLWHHLTYMVVSIALLGFGAAGSILTARRDTLRTESPMPSLTVFTLLYGVAVIVSFAVLRVIPINSLELWQDKTNLLALLAIYAVVAVPFLLAGTALGMALTRFVQHVDRLYFVDLIGSGLGGAISVGLLAAFGASATVVLAAAFAVLAAASFSLGAGRTLRIASGITLAGMIGLSLAFTGIGPLHIEWNPPFAPGKELRPFQDDPRLVRMYSSTAEVEVGPGEPTSPLIGGDVGIRSQTPVPARIVGQDGTAPTMLFEGAADLPRFGFLRDAQAMTGQVAFQARGGSSPDVLVIGVGGGFDVMAALAWDARSVTAVEINRAMIEMVTERFDDYLGGLFRPGAHAWSDRIELQNGEGRSYARSGDARWDVIQMSGVDSFTALSTGAYTLAESYLYTTEAVQEFYAHLQDDGYINYSRFVLTHPKKPRETLRLANIALTGLEESGLEDPAAQICVFQGLRWASTIIKRGAFTPAEIDALRRFSADNDFVGIIYDPLHPAGQAYEPDARDLVRHAGIRQLLARFLAQTETTATLPALKRGVAAFSDAYVAAFDDKSDAVDAALERVGEALPSCSGEAWAGAARAFLGSAVVPARTAAEHLATTRNDYATLMRGTADQRNAFVDAYEYDISPCTDDQPFFFNYYRYSQLFSQLLSPSTDVGMDKLYHPDFPVGHMVLLASLVQVAGLALVLIFWPLRRLARAGLRVDGGLRYFAYFSALGMGFMFVEIVLMQKVVIFLGHPTLAVSVVLSSLLAFTGVGSLLSGRIRQLSARRLREIGLGIVGAIGICIVCVNHVLPALLGTPLGVRIAAVLLVVLPLGLTLGMAFPSGMRIVQSRCPQLLPWCWAINGFLSVFSSALCIVLSMYFGFTLVLVLAAAIYAVGFAVMRPAA